MDSKTIKHSTEPLTVSFETSSLLAQPLANTTRPQTTSAVVNTLPEVTASPILKQVTVVGKKHYTGATSAVIVNNGVSIVVNTSSPVKTYADPFQNPNTIQKGMLTLA